MKRQSNTIRWRAGFLGLLFFLVLLSCSRAHALESRFEELVAIETAVSRDSVRVGERLQILFSLRHPDSLTLQPAGALPEGSFIPHEAAWRERERQAETVLSEGRIVLSTLDLEAAVLPPIRLTFTTAVGDTISGFTPEVRVPVRRTVTARSELRPLKDQWVAPRSWLLPALIVLGAALAIAAALLWRRLRRKRTVVKPLRPVLPPEVTAYRELIKIESSKILEQGAFKEYYTRVIDVVRRYIEERFLIDAMDRTTDELRDSLRDKNISIGGLDDMLREGDLVKFAKFSPGIESGRRLMESARRCIAETTPAADAGTDELEKRAVEG